jgi:hypothetical protein
MVKSPSCPVNAFGLADAVEDTPKKALEEAGGLWYSVFAFVALVSPLDS